MAPFERPFFTAEAPASRHHYGSAMCIGTPSGGAFSLAEQGEVKHILGRPFGSASNLPERRIGHKKPLAVPPETVPGTPDG